MQVTFLRHGQSEHNAGLSPDLDSKLTDLGMRQALATADRFVAEGLTKGNTVAFVSPLLRTLQTIAPSQHSIQFKAYIFSDACEFFSSRNEGYRTFEGLSPAQLEAQFPWAIHDSYFVCENVWWPQTLEDDEMLYARASRVRDRLIHQYYDTEIDLLVVSHADPIGRMIESFLHLPPNLEGPPWSGNCAVSRLKITSPNAPAEIVLMNDMSHLSARSLLSPR